ncbi:MAG: ATP-binding protein [Parvularculaceae bacterium]
MVDPALKTPIVAGVERALADGKPIRFSRVKLARAPHAVEESARGGASVDLVIKPLAAEGDERPSYVIAAIENAADAPADGEAVATVVGGDALAQARIDELERELARTREALQSTIEQIETTNEELQASNEELMSSNEELQSTNEELSSVNEELYSVNAEYHHQNEELTRLSDDLDLLLGSTDVGVIFLDGRLNIDRYTMLPGELFNLADADLGRPLSTFRSPFEDFDPSALVREAIAAEASVERETRDREGAAWLVRAAPYARRPGAVLTVINIGSLREAETEARRNAQMLEVIRNVSNAFFVEVSRNLSSIDAMLGVDDFLGERAARARRPIQLLAAAHPDDRRALAMRFVGADQRHAGQRRGGQGGAGDNGSGDADAGEFNCVVRIWSREHGGYRHVRVNAALGPSPLGDDHARVAWRVAGVDVDAVARSELEVRERDEILTAVLRASPSMAGFVDADGRLRYVNHAYETYFGVAFDDAIGRALRETMPSEIYEAAAPRVAAAIGGERQSFVIEDALADGRRARLAATFEPTTDRRGAPAGFALTIRDVTKYYDEAANLAAVDRALAKAVRASDTAVVLVDAETGDALYANAGAKARLGYRRDLDLPTGVRIARLTPEWTEKNWLDWFGEARLGDDVVRRDVVVFDPSQIAAKADVFVTIVEDGGRRFAFVRVVENAERAAAVQNLRERSRQLAISNRDLEQFASVVAHDLRAPLRHINQFSEFLRDEVAGLKSRDADVYLKMIAEGADAMSDMIEGLLDYARLDRAPREFRALDPAACARKAAEYLQSEVDAAGATLRIDELPSIVGDETLIIRLFQNMIGNSLKYRRADATLAIVIRSEAKRDDAVARISVADNGIGVKKTHAEKIFKLFQRLHSEDEIPGLGVGLATCRRICELHNGEIELDRAYEFGAKFLISLPIARSETSPTTYAAE